MILLGAGRGGVGEGRGSSVQGERPALSVCEPGRLGEGPGLAPGGGGSRDTMRSGRGGKRGWRPSQESEPRRRKESPLWGGPGALKRGPRKKCTLEILEISLKKGEKEEGIVGKG